MKKIDTADGIGMKTEVSLMKLIFLHNFKMIHFGNSRLGNLGTDRYATSNNAFGKTKEKPAIKPTPEVRESLHFLEAVQGLTKTLAKNDINKNEFTSAMITLQNNNPTAVEVLHDFLDWTITKKLTGPELANQLLNTSRQTSRKGTAIDLTHNNSDNNLFCNIQRKLFANTPTPQSNTPGLFLSWFRVVDTICAIEDRGKDIFVARQD
ncbi:hypothetical protein CORC01_13352 [Colletotrichum orchidophilum]|uniref:Uncharacterized protein n=1 Tax=Colletotrichum orchidophilum TaxID=1209926 RepID=A0A1G4AQJ4_9PEZI|nr:uncharacterized protein CORC01_13352 [Colletotrichum orchidophilum]OHE91375.1 hypothetical protein CORC01_13352 [Colletotrichum orchidophilum]